MNWTRLSAGGGASIALPIISAFVAGAIGILIFHQGSGWLFNLIGIYPEQ